MRKILFFQILLALFLSRDVKASQLLINDDDPTIIIGDDNNSGDKIKNPKAPARRVILCEYQSETATLDFTFLANLGTAAITVTNLNTSQVWTITADTAGGFAVLPISGDAGYYYIHIQVSGGSTYSGSFTL